jgi:hypothetical protein
MGEITAMFDRRLKSDNHDISYSYYDLPADNGMDG